MRQLNDRILVVEDDASLAEWISDYLREQGFSVDVVLRGDIAVETIKSTMPDIVLLDIMLPYKNGFEICREVRASYPGPILMMTAATGESDEVLGLDIGADDYMRKPLSPRALLARIKALLRRGAEPKDFTVRVFGSLKIDALSKSVEVDGSPLELSVNEFEVLWILASQAGSVVSRDELVSRLRGFDYDGFDRSIDVRISRLRKKLNDQPGHNCVIKTVRGKGYLYAVGGGKAQQRTQG